MFEQWDLFVFFQQVRTIWDERYRHFSISYVHMRKTLRFQSSCPQHITYNHKMEEKIWYCYVSYKLKIPISFITLFLELISGWSTICYQECIYPNDNQEKSDGRWIHQKKKRKIILFRHLWVLKNSLIEPCFSNAWVDEPEFVGQKWNL